MSTSTNTRRRAVGISILLAVFVAGIIVGFAAKAAADLHLPSSPIGRPPVVVRITATPVPALAQPVTPPAAPAPHPSADRCGGSLCSVKAPVKGDSIVETGRKLAAQRGWTGAQWGALYELWDHESSWSPSARNRSSGACGIPQRHPCNGLSSLDAAAQIRWGLDYIGGRYGTPVAALAHFHRTNWY